MPTELPRTCIACRSLTAPSRIDLPGLTGFICEKCHRFQIVVVADDKETPEGNMRLVEQVLQAVGVIEGRELVARLRFGKEVYSRIEKMIGTYGQPPQFQGVPVGVALIFPLLGFVVGYTPKEVVRGVQRLGTVPNSTIEETVSTEKPFTNAVSITPVIQTARDLSLGAIWWHKTRFDRVHIIEVGSSTGEMFVKFRAEGITERLPLKDFTDEFQASVPPPPCQVGEEWLDSRENVVTVKTLHEDGATVRDNSQGADYLLPYKQFHRWRKIERKSLYDRLAGDDDPV